MTDPQYRDPMIDPDPAEIRSELARVLGSEAFRGRKRSCEFLERVVEHALAGDGDALRERALGAEMFGRPISYDTANDAVVRVKANEVRRRLAEYYRQLDAVPEVRIEIPPGTYAPHFIRRSEEIRPREGPAEPVEPVAPASRKWSMPWLSVAVGALAALLVLSGYALWKSQSSRTAIHTIAVLPLKDLSGDHSQKYFAESITEELTTDLGQISALKVISRTSATAAANAEKPLPQIARELNVDAVIEGSVRREGKQIRITAQLIDARTDQHLWAQSYTRDVTGILTLEGEVARAIADEISVELTPGERARLTRTVILSPQVQDAYFEGIEKLGAGDPRGAIVLLERAIQRDPNLAQAHARLADAYLWMGNAGWVPYREAYPRAKAEALKAIDLDNDLAEAHATLSQIVADYEWDWETQRVELERARQLNPNSAQTHWSWADHLCRHMRYDEAVAEGKRALALDPVSSRAYLSMAWVYYFSHRYDDAMAQMRQAMELTHRPEETFLPLGDIYAEMGQLDKAVETFARLGDTPHALGHLGNAYARLGRRAEAEAEVAKLEEHVRKTGVGNYEIALIYAGLNDRDKAFEWLEKGFTVRDKGMRFLLVDPPMEPLRSDPRFANLVRRVGIDR